MSENYIAVDWGSTHLRAWLYSGGQCRDSLQLPYGVSRLAEQTARQVFDRYIEPWRVRETLPVVMAGMIGSDAGWQPVPYLACPVSLHELSARLYEVAPRVWIVPGLKTASNVMRGEESQLLGALQLSPASCYVLPGTHSKWVQITGETVTDFATAMTGELHHLLMNHSLLGRGLAQQADNDAAFYAGLEKGLESPSLIDRLFDARATRVLGSLAPEFVGEWLSGLLIGAEVAAMRKDILRVTLVGSESLCSRYRRAFSLAGVQTSEVAGDSAFLQGIRSIVDAGR